MNIISILLLFMANILVYIKKYILFKSGYKVGLFASMDSMNMLDLMDDMEPSKQKRLLFFLNLSPFICFAVSLVIAILVDDFFRI